MHSVLTSSARVSPRVTHLQRRQTFTLRAKAGQRLEVRSGEVWVTQDGDPRDLVLGANECFTLDRSGQVVISALHDAAFAVRTETQALARRAEASPNLHGQPVPAAC